MVRAGFHARPYTSPGKFTGFSQNLPIAHLKSNI